MVKLIINEKNKLSHINPEIYGHFSEHLGRCIYEGIYVGEDSPIPNKNGMRTDVVEALKELKVPVLRWPGGCFADEYHWKDGIGPKETRKKMINTHWGGVTEDNSFGTHEFMEFTEQIGAKRYINGNLGSGTVQEMSEWVEYMTFGGMSPMSDLREKNGHKDPWVVDYFGVGNESWGCGGNMNPEHYGNEYRRYQTYVRNYDGEHPISKIACGPNAEDYTWTKTVLETTFKGNPGAHGFMDGFSLHFYTVPNDWDHKGQATGFDETEWYKTMGRTLYMEELLTRHSAIMNEFDPDKKIGLIVDEWGNWFDVEPGTNPGFLYQQNTIRDALVAGINLNLFNKHSDRVKMACIAQMVNVLQAVLLTEGDKMIKTPTYHVMHMLKPHQDADLLESALFSVNDIGENKDIPQVTESVSQSADGTINISLCNLSAADTEEIEIRLEDIDYQVVDAKIVDGDSFGAYNSFDNPDAVVEHDFADYDVKAMRISVTLPAHSVVMLRIKK